MVEAFPVMLARLIRMGVIKGEKVSLDCSIIWAWFKDCPSASRPNHNSHRCRKHRRRDRDASWTWDHNRERFVFRSTSQSTRSRVSLPCSPSRGQDTERTGPYMVRQDAAEAPRTREEVLSGRGVRRVQDQLLIIRRLKAIPPIILNLRNKGDKHDEKMERCKPLRYRWHAKNFLKKWWVDPDSEEFDKEFDARTLSEQGFSVGKGSLNLDSLKGKGRARATLHAACICIVMLGVAKTAVEMGRPDLVRCVKCFQA